LQALVQFVVKRVAANEQAFADLESVTRLNLNVAIFDLLDFVCVVSEIKKEPAKARPFDVPWLQDVFYKLVVFGEGVYVELSSAYVCERDELSMRFLGSVVHKNARVRELAAFDDFRPKVERFFVEFRLS
jgi:hypothetical protein